MAPPGARLVGTVGDPGLEQVDVEVAEARLDSVVESGLSYFDIKVFIDPAGNYYVLSFIRKNTIGAAPRAVVRLTYFDDDAQRMTPSAKLVLKGTMLDREFPDLDTVTPEEMLRCMSMWVPG
jgi:hypothetical protein